MSGERLYPNTSSCVNFVYNDTTSANTQTLPFVAKLLRVYVPGSARLVFATASASINATTWGSAPPQYYNVGSATFWAPGTYLVSASGCTMFAIAGKNAGADYTVNITALVSVT